MPAENIYPASNGRFAGGPSRERSSTQSTPSRKERARESSAMQDPGLKDYVCADP